MQPLARALAWILVVVLVITCGMEVGAIRGLGRELAVEGIRVHALQVHIDMAEVGLKVETGKVARLEVQASKDATALKAATKELKAQAEVDEQFLDMITALRLRVMELEAVQVELGTT